MDAFSANTLPPSDDDLYKHSPGVQNVIRHAGPGVMSEQEEWNDWMRENIAAAAKNSSLIKKSLKVEELGSTMEPSESVADSSKRDRSKEQQIEIDIGPDIRTDKKNRNSKENRMVRMVSILLCLIVLELIILLFLICRKRGILFTSGKDFQSGKEICVLCDQHSSLGDQFITEDRTAGKEHTRPCIEVNICGFNKDLRH